MATEASKIHHTLNAPNDAAAKAAISARVASPKDGMPDPRYGVEQCCVREFWAVVEGAASLVRGGLQCPIVTGGGAMPPVRN